MQAQLQLNNDPRLVAFEQMAININELCKPNYDVGIQIDKDFRAPDKITPDYIDMCQNAQGMN